MSKDKIGGSFLIKETNFKDIFILSDFDDISKQMLDATKDFVDKEIVPNIHEFEKYNYNLVEEIMRKAGSLGLLGINVPEEYGGLGMSFNLSLLICGEISAWSGSVATAYGAHTGIGTYPVLYYANENLKQKFLPKIASGEWIACYNLTEPNAGSDANSGVTKAILSADKKYYEITGQKIWISNAGFSEVFIVFARIENDKNITAFIIQKSKSEGITLGDEEKKLGLRSSSTRQVFYDKTKIPVTNILGERNGGFKIAINALNVGRIKLGAAVISAAEKILNVSIEYAIQRKQFKNAIINYGAISEKLANMASKVYCSNAAIYRAGHDIDVKIKQLTEKGDNQNNAKLNALLSYAIECSIIKVHGSEVIKYIADQAVQIHGGMGYSADTLVEPAYRDARISSIYEGTNEINRMLIVDMILKKAIKKEVQIFKKARKLQKEIILILAGINTNIPKSKIQNEKKAICNLKKLAILILGLATSKYKAKIIKEQEILMRIADIIIEVYIAESAILKTEKLIEKKEYKNCQTEINMSRNYLQNAIKISKESAEEVIQATTTGIKRKILLSVNRKLTKSLNYNMKNIRRSISERLKEDGKYKFSI